MDNNFSFLAQLNTKQREVCTSEDNYILTACPGSGKTRTITYRLAYLHTKYFPSRLLNIAITYTNRAADEIYTRLDGMGIDTATVWTGTIHQFCMRFIIRPYAMYSDRLRNGYHVIDEFIRKQYCDEIASSLGIRAGQNNPLSNPLIKAEYCKRLCVKKEIDFDMILELSDALLSDHSFIAENISHVIRSIHIDEFQDTNELQYSILARIVQKNKHINVVFVGDVNQAIYGGLGGIAKTSDILSQQFGINFKDDSLTGCYRSTQRIIDFYTHFEVAPTGIESVSDRKNIYGIISYDYTIHKDALPQRIAQIISSHLSSGVLAHNICVVAPQWFQIYPFAKRLRDELPSVNFDAPDIMPFKYDPMNPFYLLARLLFTTPGVNVRARKRMAAEFLDILESEYRVSIPSHYDNYLLLKVINSAPLNTQDGLLFYKHAVTHIFHRLQIPFERETLLQEAYTAFLEKAEHRIEQFHLPHSCNDFYACFKEREGIVINTIHGIKGEEYEVVIGFDLLNGHLPNWDYIMDPNKALLRKNETLKLLYVLCSRAKTSLYLFSETGRTTKKGFPLAATNELYSVDYSYDIV